MEKERKPRQRVVVAFYGTPEWNTWLSSLSLCPRSTPRYRSSSHYPKLHWHPPYWVPGGLQGPSLHVKRLVTHHEKYLYIRQTWCRSTQVVAGIGGGGGLSPLSNRFWCGKPRQTGALPKDQLFGTRFVDLDPLSKPLHFPHNIFGDLDPKLEEINVILGQWSFRKWVFSRDEIYNLNFTSGDRWGMRFMHSSGVQVDGQLNF